VLILVGCSPGTLGGEVRQKKKSPLPSNGIIKPRNGKDPAPSCCTGQAERPSGLFIWAATACRFIREGKRFAVRRLHTILEGSSSGIIPFGGHADFFSAPGLTAYSLVKP
jgi:hypothetical protein